MKTIPHALCAATLFLAAAATHALDLFPSVDVPAPSVQSDAALAYLDLDFENRPGWVAGVKGGYQWIFYQDHGTRVYDVLPGADYVVRDDTTKSGAAGSASLGYNFGPRLPLTIGLNVGFGAGGNLNTHGAFSTPDGDFDLSSRQKIRILTLDLGIDYDFKNHTRWTPFLGVTGGVAFISDKAKSTATGRGAGGVYYGHYNKKHRTNLVGGFRAGVKYCLSERAELSLYGSYTYLGSIKGHSYDLAGAPGNAVIGARSEKIKAHAVDAKIGVKINF